MDVVKRGLQVLLVFSDSQTVVMRLDNKVDPPPWMKFIGTLYPNGKHGKSVSKKATVFLVESTARELLPIYNER